MQVRTAYITGFPTASTVASVSRVSLACEPWETPRTVNDCARPATSTDLTDPRRAMVLVAIDESVTFQTIRDRCPKLGEQTIRNALRCLCNARLVDRTMQRGKKQIYELTPEGRRQRNMLPACTSPSGGDISGACDD